MESLASLDGLRDRINRAVADKVIGKILTTEARHHFNHGYKTDCQCTVCDYRRIYTLAQSGRNNDGHRTMSGGWFDMRYHRKELNRAFKKKVLGEQ